MNFKRCIFEMNFRLRNRRFYRMFFGDTGDELMRRAPCPVLVVPYKNEKTARINAVCKRSQCSSGGIFKGQIR